MTRPRVAVSSCLLGHLVRWDGTHKANEIVRTLDEHVDILPVCGVFADVVTSLRPHLPVAEENDVDDNFLERVLSHATARQRR